MLMNATQFPRMYQHNMLIPWNKDLSCRINSDASLHTLDHDTLPQPRNQASKLNLKNISNKERTHPPSLLVIWRWKGVVGCMQTTMNLNLHRQFAAYKHAFINSFIWPSRQHWKMDWGNIASSSFMNQKIRSKNDRFPQGDRSREKIHTSSFSDHAGSILSLLTYSNHPGIALEIYIWNWSVSTLQSQYIVRE